MYKSVLSFNIITSLDVSLKTCKPGSEVVQDALSGRSHLGVLSSEQFLSRYAIQPVMIKIYNYTIYTSQISKCC